MDLSAIREKLFVESHTQLLFKDASWEESCTANVSHSGGIFMANCMHSSVVPRSHEKWRITWNNNEIVVSGKKRMLNVNLHPRQR